MTTPTWFQKHALQVRPIEWGGAAPLDAHAEAAVATDGDAGAEAGPGAELGAPAAAFVPVAALEASEQTLAIRTAELADAAAQLTELNGEISMARAAATEARQTLVDVTEKTLANAELELVKLALAIAERVVGRELATSPELIVGWAREALAASTLSEGLVVAVSSDVASSVDAAHWEDLGVALFTDASLPPSTCELRDGKTTITVGGGDRLDLVGEQLATIPARAA